MRNRPRREQSLTRSAVLFASLTLCGLDLGCGESPPAVPEGMHLQSVRGLVMQANGAPLSQGKIVLTPQQESGKPLTGWVDSDGTFTLMEGQGLAISHGEFTVHIEPPPLPPDLAAGKTPKAKEIAARLQKAQQQVPAKYQKPETSKLKVTIGPETRTLPTFVLR